MKLNILIVGKNSFLSKNLFKFLKKKINVKKIGFIEFLKLKKIKLLKYDVVINCAINKLYYKKKYSEKNDIDLICGKKLSNLNQKLIIFSTSKVYGPGSNLKENSKKNQLITMEKIN